MPAFSASVSAPKKVVFADNIVPITVGAQYTFGQKVEGSAVVTFKKYGYDIVYERSVAINSSSVTFDVDIKNDLKLDIIYSSVIFAVEIQFTDKLTAQLATATSEFLVVESRHTILVKGAPNFKPGLPYVFSVIVKNLDDSPVSQGSEINLKTAFNDVYGTNQTFELDLMGSVELEENVPSNAYSIKITVSFIIN